jgi:virulence-associated protein VapD
MNILNDDNKANQSCKMRLKILDRKIRSSKNKYNNFETEEKTINKLDYHKLKRYKNYSSSYLNKFQKKQNNIYSTDTNIRREAKINIIKNEINKMNSINKDISDIKVNNMGEKK